MGTTCLTPAAAALAAAALLSAAPAQDVDAASPATPDQLLERAERALALDAREDALLFLWSALRMADDIAPAARAAFDESVEALRASADPLRSEWKKVDAANADDLVSLARTYQRRRMWRVVVALLEEADALQPGVADKALEYARGRLPTDPGAAVPKDSAGGLAGPRDRTPEFEPSVDVGGWTVGAREIVGPQLDGETVFVFGTTLAHGNNDVGVRIRLGDAIGRAALMFGVRDSRDYYLAEVGHRELDGGRRFTRVRVFHYDGAMRTLGETGAYLSPEERAGWLDVTVSIHGKRIAVRLADGKPRVIDCPTEPHGGVGFFVSGDSRNPQPVHFSGLTIEPATAFPDGTMPAADSDGVDVGLRVRTALADASAAEDVEDAVLALDRARAALARVGKGPARDLLVGQVDGISTKRDPFDRRRRSVRVDIADRLVQIANRYVDAGMERAAVEVLRRAARHDVTTTVAALEKLGQDLGPPATDTPVEEAAPADPEPEVDNTETIRWFAKGDQKSGPLGCWTIDEHGARARHLAQTSSIILTAKPLTVPCRVRVETLVDVEMRGAGFAFDWHAHDDFSIVSLRPTIEEDLLMLRVLRWRDGKWTDLGGKDIPRPKSMAHRFVELEVELHDDRIVARANGSAPLTAFVEGPRGPFGLFAEITESSAADVHFRALRVEPIE